jgi:hypothetical protein
MSVKTYFRIIKRKRKRVRRVKNKISDKEMIMNLIR